MKDGNYSIPCPLWPANPERCELTLVLRRLFSTVSLIGCLLIVFAIWLFRLNQSLVQKLIKYLSISAGLCAVSHLIGDLYTNVTSCQFTAFMLQYFDWATLLWVCAISLHMIFIINNKYSSRHELYYHLVCWGLPLLWAIIPFFSNSYGQAGLWCWIERDATALRFGTWYVPTFMLFVALVVGYIYIYVRVIQQVGSWRGLFKTEEQNENNMLLKEVQPLAVFPLIYIVFSIPNIIYRFDDAFHPDKYPSFPLLILNVLFLPSIGGANAIAFAVFSKIQTKLTWNQIKFAFIGHFQPSLHVVHDVDVDDEEVLTAAQVNGVI